MNDTKIIQINIDGPVQSGKSAIFAEIRMLLEHHGYCVAIPDREERYNPSDTIENAAKHERPSLSRTVVILTESVSA